MTHWRKPKENYGVKSVLSKCGRHLIKKKNDNCYQILLAKGSVWEVTGEANNLEKAKKMAG